MTVVGERRFELVVRLEAPSAPALDRAFREASIPARLVEDRLLPRLVDGCRLLVLQVHELGPSGPAAA